MDKLPASEALYGFCGWLTTRDEVTEMGASKDSAIVAYLIKQFCDENDLPEPRDHWADLFTMPKE